jgi:hypothetical protein
VILQPSILALLFSSTFLVLLLVYAAVFAGRILRRWDLSSGSEVQLQLERRTYLISTILAWAFGFQLLSLFLFIHTADSLAPMFVGAMCAAGTLYADPWGYPTLLLKIATFLAAGLWLVLNHADNRAWDYPLIRPKYFLLLGIAPLVLVESGIQAAYFLGLKADVITSCCSSLFSTSAATATRDLGGALAGWRPQWAIPAFFIGMAAVVALAVTVARSGRGGMLLGMAGGGAMVLSFAAIVSFVSPYIYEDPRHHCPFCILKAEYSYQGYALYVPLFAATAAAMGALALAPFARRPELRARVTRATRALARAAGTLYLVFTLAVAWMIANSALILVGHVAR